MAKKSSLLTNKNLGIALFIGLFIQFVFPAIQLGSVAWVATIIYFVVALVLLLR